MTGTVHMGSMSETMTVTATSACDRCGQPAVSIWRSLTARPIALCGSCLRGWDGR